jgi:tRNA(Arg) A34 adenosine deaminase TadA
MTEPASSDSDASAHEQYMRAAIAAARRGMLAGEPPVGACLVRDGEVVATVGNGVIGELDVTAHAEMRAIREACQRLRSLSLDGCVLYATVEPCPMCLSACHYAGIDEVVYGASLADMQAITGRELEVRHATLAERGLDVAISGPLLADECRDLLGEWSRETVR